MIPREPQTAADYDDRTTQDTRILADRTPAQWQQDAFGQVDAWLRALGIRS
jgi:hypothetical protein